MKKVKNIFIKCKEFIVKRILNKKIYLIILAVILIISGIFINNIGKVKIKSSNDKEENECLKEITIEVKGEVNNPGNYSIYKETYLFEIIQLCNGFTNYADLENINLVQKIDGPVVININNTNEYHNNKIHMINLSNNMDFNYIYLGYIKNEVNIYKVDKGLTYKELFWKLDINNKFNINLNEKIEKDIYLKKLNNTDKLCINTATIEELTSLKNIGQSTASKIIEYRDNNGLFKNIEDIMKVSGIGINTFNLIKDSIYIN